MRPQEPRPIAPVPRTITLANTTYETPHYINQGTQVRSTANMSIFDMLMSLSGMYFCFECVGFHQPLASSSFRPGFGAGFGFPFSGLGGGYGGGFSGGVMTPYPTFLG